MLTSFHWLIMRKTEKGNNSVTDFENFTKINQVIYTLDTIYEPNFMTLAQAVLEIFFHKLTLAYNEKNRKGT